jgi:hypothetical protein
MFNFYHLNLFFTKFYGIFYKNYRHNYFFCAVTINAKEFYYIFMVVFFSNKFFPKSKKENGFWTF